MKSAYCSVGALGFSTFCPAAFAPASLSAKNPCTKRGRPAYKGSSNKDMHHRSSPRSRCSSSFCRIYSSLPCECEQQ